MTATAFLIHGLTSGPSVLAPVTRLLKEHGISTITPTIAGHCTSVAELAKTSLNDWIDSVERPLISAWEQHGPLVIGGISLGGLLSIEVALRHPQKVKGVILMAAPFTFPAWLTIGFSLIQYSPLRFFYKGQKRRDMGISDPEARHLFECYDFFPFKSIQNLFTLQRRVRHRLSELKPPVLAIYAKRDRIVPLSSLSLLQTSIPAQLATVLLEKSEHIVTLDVERDEVARACLDFIHRIARI